MFENYLTVSQIIALLGKTKGYQSVLTRALNAGTLRGQKVGSQWFIERNELMRWRVWAESNNGKRETPETPTVRSKRRKQAPKQKRNGGAK